jgi:glycine/D-amino acid oxidase-like deaminating enzyme
MNLWDATLKNKSPERASLKKTEEVDVAIIGAGFTGLWSAYHLLSHNPDLKIAIIEKERVGLVRVVEMADGLARFIQAE